MSTLPISPLVGEMSAQPTEGGASRDFANYGSVGRDARS